MNNKYVIKHVEVDNITEAELCQKEANQLREFQHKNIIKFIEDFIHIEHNFCRNKYFHVIIMEYCKKGDLIQFLEANRQTRKKIKEKVIVNILEQLCKAIVYIHGMNVVHRDIKLGNILMCKDNTIRLSDFGLSDKIGKIRTRKVGTRSYMAPEEFKEFYKGSIDEEYSLENKKASDMWCVGCVLYELCTGQLVVNLGFTLGKKMAQRQNFLPELLTNVSTSYSKGLRNIIKDLLNVDPKKRPRADEILRRARSLKHQLSISHNTSGKENNLSLVN